MGITPRASLEGQGNTPTPPGHMAELGLMLGRGGDGWPRIWVPSNPGDQAQPRAHFDHSVLGGLKFELSANVKNQGIHVQFRISRCGSAGPSQGSQPERVVARAVWPH